VTYTPQTWSDAPSTATPISATRLNYMEAGIANNFTRQTTTEITASLVNLANQQSTLALAAGYRIYSVTVDQACRVRLYPTTGQRTADLARNPGTDPVGDAGVIMDLVFTAAGTLTLSPTVDGFVSSGTNALYTIQNRSGSTSTVQVDFLWVRTE